MERWASLLRTEQNLDIGINFSGAHVKAKLPITDKFRIFARGGYTTFRLDFVSRPSCSDQKGASIGGGLEYDFKTNLAVRGDYSL